MGRGFVEGCGGHKFVADYIATIPKEKYLAHYMASWQNKADRNQTCTEQRPYFAFPGSNWHPVNQPEQTWWHLTLGQVNRPAETVWGTDGFLVIQSWAGMQVGGTGYCAGARMHSEGGNYIFVDGHVKSMKESLAKQLAQTPDGCWYRKYQAFDL
jgi:prepilin-type processing-associated H-X9-DG protein